jgi:hypothetical protein
MVAMARSTTTTDSRQTASRAETRQRAPFGRRSPAGTQRRLPKCALVLVRDRRGATAPRILVRLTTDAGLLADQSRTNAQGVVLLRFPTTGEVSDRTWMVEVMTDDGAVVSDPLVGLSDDGKPVVCEIVLEELPGATSDSETPAQEPASEPEAPAEAGEEEERKRNEEAVIAR